MLSLIRRDALTAEAPDSDAELELWLLYAARPELRRLMTRELLESLGWDGWDDATRSWTYLTIDRFVQALPRAAVAAWALANDAALEFDAWQAGGAV